MSFDIPTTVEDAINEKILMISEDQVIGFLRQPFHEIARQSGVELSVVLERIGAMLEAGTIRRVRQTLLATNLASGALIAWKVSADHLTDAFEWMFANDPFSGHVVLRSTDSGTVGGEYKLWTTLKVPQGYSMEKHCDFLMKTIGAENYLTMPAKRLFKLGVGHMRRRKLEPGSRAEQGQAAMTPKIQPLNEQQWRVLIALKRELSIDEVCENPWEGRAAEAGVSFDEFCTIAEKLNDLKVIGRFSTFLEHVKKVSPNGSVTSYNGLFHWAVPPGKEIEAGTEVGRHHCMTHAYWRDGGPAFNNVNIMGVVHGNDRDLVLAHKAAIDEHLKEAGIPVLYTAVFWGGRSEIKPSEISPFAYVEWCKQHGLDV